MNPASIKLRDPLVIEPIHAVSDLKTRREKIDLLALPGVSHPRYIVGFANSTRTIQAALRLRYEVFNLELGEGLSASTHTGLDEDTFDQQMTHLVILDRETERAVGTYRLQTMAHALSHFGVYSGEEYDLTALEPYFYSAVECGRACIAKEHRSPATLMMLWQGIRTFVLMHEQRFLFGCCSLTSIDPDDGWRAMKTIRKQNYLHPDLMLPAHENYSCGSPEREFDPAIGDAIKLPKLFSVYMRLGCKVISVPALDRAFGTVDFLILMDGTQVTMSALEAMR